MEFYFQEIWLARLLIQKGMAALYLIAFISAFNQFPALLGEKGLQPVKRFIKQIPFRKAPSIFYLHYSDRFLRIVAGAGALIAALALFGITESGPIWLSVISWLAMWLLYLSIVNVGQTFYGFGWESMLLEAGFFTAFLGSNSVAPALVPILALRWMLFRTELGAGLIKMRADSSWRDLTAMYYHHETQPLPNPLSWYFHQLPKRVHRFSTAFNHFVQLVVPFGLFAPQSIANVAAAIIILHQLILVISGNYSWLNWITIILAFSAIGHPMTETFAATPTWWNYTQYGLAALIVALSIQPTLNLFSKDQKMNYSYNPFHLVGAYGAFGSMTKARQEVIVEGSIDGVEWQEYEFKAKPGDLKRRPPQIAPYHLRLDWLMWFLPLGFGIPDWFFEFTDKLLTNDKQTLKLIRKNPFPDQPPVYIRANFYHYQFTTKAEKRENGRWWKRKKIQQYLPPTKLS